jgi:hypothetical protein
MSKWIGPWGGVGRSGAEWGGVGIQGQGPGIPQPGPSARVRASGHRAPQGGAIGGAVGHHPYRVFSGRRVADGGNPARWAGLREGAPLVRRNGAARAEGWCTVGMEERSGPGCAAEGFRAKGPAFLSPGHRTGFRRRGIGHPNGGDWGGRSGITRIASFQAAGCQTAETRPVGPG